MKNLFRFKYIVYTETLSKNTTVSREVPQSFSSELQSLTVSVFEFDDCVLISYYGKGKLFPVKPRLGLLQLKWFDKNSMGSKVKLMSNAQSLK